MKRFHSHKNGTAWKPKKKRWFFRLNEGRIVSPTGDGSAGSALLTLAWTQNVEKGIAIEVSEADLPYLEKPKGEWEFKKAKKGDVFKGLIVIGDSMGHGLDEIAQVDLHSGLQGHRWCKKTANLSVEEIKGWQAGAMNSFVDETIKAINDQREEILEAFVAKYGFEPDEAEQVHQQTRDGNRWFVRKRGDS